MTFCPFGCYWDCEHRSSLERAYARFEEAATHAMENGVLDALRGDHDEADTDHRRRALMAGHREMARRVMEIGGLPVYVYPRPDAPQQDGPPPATSPNLSS